ncbi:hypothetical protein ACJZ2D_013917 [Fusarium nematophilum]
MAHRRNVLVTGATGRQGRALIRALIHTETPSVDFECHVLALTRSASSEAAGSLLGKQGELAGRITIVEGDLNDKDGIRKIFEDAVPTGGVWGVFAVLAYPGLTAKADIEERQGKVESALEPYTLRARNILITCICADAGRTCAGIPGGDISLLQILRPGFFMENFDGFQGAMAVGIFHKCLTKDTTIALVASEDIGSIAAGVFQDHERFLGKTLCVTSELATMTEVMDSYRRAVGKPMPTIPGFVGGMLVKVNSGVQRIIKQIERAHEARVNGEDSAFDSQVELARSVCKMQTYSEWKAKTRPRETDRGKWNQVSFLKLFTGRS